MHVKEDAESGMNPETSKKEEEPFAFLLFGISEASPPDTFILALIDVELQKVQLISVPRDSYVDIPGYRKDKINSAYSKGGASLLRKTLENWLGVKIAGYASINYQGFIDLVNIIDGLNVNVSRDMQYDDPVNGTHINIKKGQQVLDGQKALDFVRFRQSNDGNHASDYDRMERQQTALKILADKLISIKSLSRYQEILNILSSNIKTTLTVEEINLLIRKFYSFDTKNLQTSSIM
jgi:LCP family protein required for cell wall assembly